MGLPCCGGKPKEAETDHGKYKDDATKSNGAINLQTPAPQLEHQGSVEVTGDLKRNSSQLSTEKKMSGLQKNPTAVMARAHDTNIKLEDEYTIEKKKVLGTGFCGSVFMAKSKVTGELVAVKSLDKVDVGDGEETVEEIMARVRSECEIYLNCDHPNISRLRDMYETDTTIFLVCDCCTGGELYDRLVSRGQYTEKSAAMATKGMLLAVSYIHNTLHIVHRDLKLQNWLYPSKDSEDDQIKLIDFGFSKLVEKKKKLTCVTAGTVEYLAPELLFHQSEVKFPGDMWAMGVILFMLLGGYPPFSGKNNKEIIAAIRDNEIKWFKSRFDKVSSQAKSLILGLLCVDPVKRLTAVQALEHPWVKQMAEDGSAAAEVTLDDDVLKALCEFGQKSAFEKATAMIMTQCMSGPELRRLEKIFLTLDQTHEGSVQFWELKDAMKKAQESGSSTDLGEDDKIALVFDNLDFNDDHHIYFSDFVTAVVCKKIDTGSDELIKATFDRFDVDNSGEISLQNLQNLFGDEFRNVKIEDMLKEVDADGNQLIDFHEFKTFLKKKNKIGVKK